MSKPVTQTWRCEVCNAKNSVYDSKCQFCDPPPAITFGQWRQLCQSVITNCNNEYAQAYARAGLSMLDHDAIKVQALYILNNMQHWRTQESKRVRAILRSIAK